MAWRAITALGGVELRRAWRTLVVLGVLAGLAGGVVLAALALGRRTQTAPDRLRAAVQLDDARVLVFGDQALGRRIAALPMVERSWTAQSLVAQVEGEDVTYAGLSSGPPPPPGLFSPVVVEGRPAVEVDEVVVVEELAEQYGLSVGQTLRMKLLTPAEVAQFDTGFGEPDGPRLTLTITGMVRMPVAQGVSGMIASPRLAFAYERYSVGPTVLMRLRPGSEGALVAALDQLSKEAVLPADAEEFGPLQPVFPARAEDPKVRTAQRVLVAGLGVFVLVAGLAGLIATSQSLSRHHAAGAGEQRIEAALGLTTLERVLARAVPAVLGGAVAAAVAAGTALAAAGLNPMGGLHRYEPHPGWAPNVALLAAGAVAVGATFVGAAAVTTWRAGRSGGPGSRRAFVLPNAVATRLRRPWLLAGTTFAVSRGRGRSAVPVRATALGAVLGLAGVVAAATFSAGLHRLGEEPERYGWAADFTVIDAKPIDLPNIALDPRVVDLDWVAQTAVRIDGAFVPAYAPTSIKGDMPWTVLEGRLPGAVDEIALGPSLADQLGVLPGETATVTDAKGEPHRLRVVGTVLTPVDGSQMSLGASVVMTSLGLTPVQQSPPTTSMLVRTTPGSAEGLRQVLARRFEIIRAAPPTEVRQVLDLGRLPDVLALFLAAVAAAALAHGLVLTSRRRAHDIGVLRALGFTRRQVAASVLTMSGVTAAVGLVVGIPLGLAIGRVVWHQVAAGIPVAGDVAMPWSVLVGLWPVVLVAAAALALLPARHSAAVRPAGVLRTE